MKILVVGCGSIGGRHLRNLLDLGMREVSVYDPDAGRRDAVRAAHPVRVHDRWEEALAERPALALVCTPTDLHLPAALDLARNGCHLFIEKPLADRPEGIPGLVAEVERRSLVGLVGCDMRFHSVLRSLCDEVRAGEIGRVLHLRAHFGYYLPDWRPGVDYRTTYSAHSSRGGGIILDSIHEIDYVRWMVGEAVKVYARAGRSGVLEMDAEDTADLLIWFRSGATASIHLDCLDRVKRRSCEVVGTEGTRVWRSTGKQPEEAVLERYRDNDRRQIESSTITPNVEYVSELKHLIDCVEGRTEPLLSLREAWADLGIAWGALASAASGRPVAIDPVWERGRVAGIGRLGTPGTPA